MVISVAVVGFIIVVIGVAAALVTAVGPVAVLFRDAVIDAIVAGVVAVLVFVGALVLVLVVVVVIVDVVGRVVAASHTWERECS